MSELTFSFDEDLVEEAEATGGSFGTVETGIFKGVTINFASLGKTANGNNTVALDITTADGHDLTIWSAFMTIDKTWSSGSENFGYKDWQAFMVACGAKTITPTPFALKKDDGTLIKDLSVIKELHGVKCSLAIQKRFTTDKHGDEKIDNIIHSSYNAKGQTYLEAKGNQPAEKIEKVATRLKDKITKEWKALGNSAPVVEEEEMTGLL